ncbi:cytochrome B6 [Saccharophagus sp. K07]|uniref:cytochrome B6 n=1 Tax=Saccharophagus sp. K07 TaxID=2283636 RepID=UPI0016521F39|nr:cytochrome B6 [Saccharophagus sp. K07]MBC6905448.1 cytochrome B6 [Saccharophagus sp. K07]
MKNKILVSFILAFSLQAHQSAAQVPTSYSPVVDKEPFEAVKKRLSQQKPQAEERFRKLLNERYDLADRPIPNINMTRGKKIQGGVRVKLPRNVTWDQLANMAPDEIKQKNLWPAGFYPLPHELHQEGGMLFPQFHIDRMRQQEKRDLARFDISYQLPDHFLPEYPPAIFLTTRPDLGDVSKGQVVTNDNFYELFNGILNPKQLEGLRLLVRPTMQQQFNATADRRSERPSLGVTCFDCHVNGHTNAATHLVGDIRPQENRRRIDTPSLRGVNIQRLFGSQRALKTIEDFSEFEQRAAYFDGDPVIAAKKGVTILERGSEVHTMSEFQALLDFPPAPKLDVFGRLDPAKASDAELRGEQLFHGKARCATCHIPPYYTDNLMHDLQAHRFYQPRNILGRLTVPEGPIKTFPLRGIKESGPYLHDGRLLTLADAVEFFNLVLGTKLTEAEKADVVAFLLAL